MVGFLEACVPLTLEVDNVHRGHVRGVNHLEILRA